MDNEKSVKDELAQQLYGVESVVKDSLYDALVSDEMPKNQTLEEHDRRHHNGHFDQSTQTCKFREELSVETETDKADELDSDKETGTKKQDTDREPNKPTPEEEYQTIVDAYTNPDGSKKEGWLKAPNGKETNLTERQWVQVRTPSFKEWFGDWENDPENSSKVIDENGEPKVMYHQTNNEFSVFKKDQGNNGIRTSAPNWVFTKETDDIIGLPIDDDRDPIQMALFEKIINPLRFNTFDDAREFLIDNIPFYDTKMKMLDGLREKWMRKIADSDNPAKEAIEYKKAFDKEAREIRDYVEEWYVANGYDGVIIEDDKGITSFIVPQDNVKSATDNTGKFSTIDNDIRHSISDDGDTEEFSEDFWATVNPERGSSYSSEFGEDDGEALDKYEETFTNDGKYRMPFRDGKFSKEIMEKVRLGGDSDVWDEGSREDAEAAGRVLSNLLGGVSFELSDKPYEGRGDSRKSISGIYTGSSSDYNNPSLLKVGTGEGSYVFGWGLYGSNKREVAEGYSKSELDETHEANLLEKVRKALLDSGVDKESAGKFTDKLYEHGSYPGRMIRELRKEFGEDSKEVKEFNEFEPTLKKVYEEDGTPFDLGRYIYEQTFFTDREDGDESHLLMWEEPIGLKKLKAITEALPFEKQRIFKSWVRDSLPYGNKPQHAWGGDIYQAIANTLDGYKSASEFLRDKCGYDGVKVPVGAFHSMQKQNGDDVGWNYVSFRDDNIRVDHKWVDGEQRYFKNQAGKVVGEYDRKTGKITLYPGAKINDVVHEFSHGLWQFAEQEAKEGRTGLQDKLHKIAHSAPDAVKDAVGRNYADQNPNVILEECFTHEMARRSEQNKEFAKAIRTARGKKWYQRAWGAIKDTYKGFSRKMGWDKSDVGELDKMDAHEAADWILKQMSKGKRFGDVTPEQQDGGVKGRKSGVRKSIIGEKGAANLGIGRLDEAKKMVEDGSGRMDIWKKTGWWKGKDGMWRVEIPDLDPKGGEFNSAISKAKGDKEKITLGDILEDGELFTSYPHLKNVELAIKDFPKGVKGNAKPEVISISSKVTDEMEFGAVLSHEIQHLIQGIEGFSRGSSPQRIELDDKERGERTLAAITIKSLVGEPDEDGKPLTYEEAATQLFYNNVEYPSSSVFEGNAYEEILRADNVEEEVKKILEESEKPTESAKERYLKLEGEVESRNAEERRFLTQEERAETPPWETEDIPEEEQIVRKQKPNFRMSTPIDFKRG